MAVDQNAVINFTKAKKSNVEIAKRLEMNVRVHIQPRSIQIETNLFSI